MTEERASLALEIADAARDTCVVFVDLERSTEIKMELKPDEWLVYVAGFLLLIKETAITSNGKVVKRIGDEVMLTFAEPHQAESFFRQLVSDSRLADYRFKCAADYGKAFFFQFEAVLEPDPYGIVVDRCARIAKLARSSTVLCSSTFVTKLDDTGDYIDLGKFPLKGIADPMRLFVRCFYSEAPTDYHARILEALNAPKTQFSGFKTESRLLTADDLRRTPRTAYARPFLLRELTNVPRLPLSPQELIRAIKMKSDVDQSKPGSECIGYLVEWAGVLDHYSLKQDYVEAWLNIAEAHSRVILVLNLVPEMIEVVRRLRKGDTVYFRGVITDYFFGTVILDYVELLGTGDAGASTRQESGGVANSPSLPPPLAPSETTSWWRRLFGA
jgi:class 3 adenylate cyclase